MVVDTLREILKDLPGNALVTFQGALDGHSHYYDFMAVGKPSVESAREDGYDKKCLIIYLIPERREIEITDTRMRDEDAVYFPFPEYPSSSS